MIPIRILLTFDDGPHDGPLGGANRTEKVLDALNHKRAKAAFFVQTHAPHRLSSPSGFRIASRIHGEGHVLAVHTGGFVDHRCHKWRCTQQADLAGATNGLDSDMIRAKGAIRKIAGSDPKFVRATYGYTDAGCMEVYARNRLRHVYWDLTSGDDREGATAASVRAHLTAEMKRLSGRAMDVICLMHDIKGVTAEYLSDFIDTLSDAVRANGGTPVFVADRAEAELVMDRKSRQGTDTPCPAGSMD